MKLRILAYSMLIGETLFLLINFVLIAVWDEIYIRESNKALLVFEIIILFVTLGIGIGGLIKESK